MAGRPCGSLRQLLQSVAEFSRCPLQLKRASSRLEGAAKIHGPADLREIVFLRNRTLSAAVQSFINCAREIAGSRTLINRMAAQAVVRRMSGYGAAASGAKRPFVRKQHPVTDKE